MNITEEEPSSQKEKSLADQRRILKATRSKPYVKKEQQKPSQRDVVLQLDQLDVIRVLGEGNLGVKLVSYKYFQELSAKLSSLWIAMIRRSLPQ